MCFICDGGTEEEFDDLVDSCINGEPGWFVMGVYDADGPPGWAYTIGLQERFDHPELVLTGRSCFHCAGATINEIGVRVAAGEKFVEGDHVWLADGRGEVRFGSVHENHWLTDRFNAWKGFYRSRRSRTPVKAALQLIWLKRPWLLAGRPDLPTMAVRTPGPSAAPAGLPRQRSPEVTDQARRLLRRCCSNSASSAARSPAVKGR
jgi:hypothetical protein